jgi:hypothetical protein
MNQKIREAAAVLCSAMASCGQDADPWDVAEALNVIWAYPIAADWFYLAGSWALACSMLRNGEVE